MLDNLGKARPQFGERKGLQKLAVEQGKVWLLEHSNMIFEMVEIDAQLSTDLAESPTPSRQATSRAPGLHFFGFRPR